MTEFLVGCLCFSLFAAFCFRNFFVQLTALKLLVDCLVLAVATFRGVGQDSVATQSTAIIIMSTGILVFFILMTCGIRHFSKLKSLDLEAPNE